jgi:hypothetical protein
VKRVGVFPGAALAARRRLFDALEQAFPVRFEPAHEPDASAAAAPSGTFDALVAFAEPPVAGAHVAAGELAGPAKRFIVDPADGAAVAGRIDFTVSARLDGRLRGRALAEEHAPAAGIDVRAGDEILARIADRVVWVKRGDADVVAGGPAELRPGGFLRDLVTPGRVIGLLPLVHFLREVTADLAWERPAPRAAFVVDDPNLHWRSYGYIRYPELVRSAREHRYHAVMAMVALDGWYAHGDTVRLFRESGDVLSLVVHGNDHRRHDLERAATSADARRVLAAAQARIGRFERRTGLEVGRVMVPPHEACSAACMEAMAEMGFDAACATRAYLWLGFGSPPSAYNAPWPDHVLSGWQMTELLPNGFPVLIRREPQQADDVMLRRFFDQPLILYAHAWDFADGLGPLERAAALVNSWPGVVWAPLPDVAAACYETRLEATTLRVRPFARRVRVPVPEGVEKVAIEPPLRAAGFEREPIAVAGPGTLEIAFGAPATTVNGHRRRFDGPAIARRLLVEARDRLQPLVR